MSANLWMSFSSLHCTTVPFAERAEVKGREGSFSVGGRERRGSSKWIEEQVLADVDGALKARSHV